jgi:hypothetical protein
MDAPGLQLPVFKCFPRTRLLAAAKAQRFLSRDGAVARQAALNFLGSL